MAGPANQSSIPSSSSPRASPDDSSFDGKTTDGRLSSHPHTHSRHRLSISLRLDKNGDSIALPSTFSNHADMTITPFLKEHIPNQYAPQGRPEDDTSKRDSNTKYCYRHRPDLKCRRQANEPSMGQLQSQLQTLSQRDQQAISQVWSVFSAAPSKHRNLMLGGILSSCCFPQLSYLSGVVRDLIRIDFLAALPAEISCKILCFLDTTSLCKAAQVSRTWRSLAEDDEVWHRMCEQHIDRKCTKCGVGLPLMEQKRLRASKRQNQLRASGRGLNVWSPQLTPPADTSQGYFSSSSPEGSEPSVLNANGKRPSSPPAPTSEPSKKPRPSSPSPTATAVRRRPWKEVYRDRFKIGSNWRHGRCTTRVFTGHTNGVMCLQFNDTMLATGSYDNSIKIWDMASGTCLRTLSGHERGVRCLQFDEHKLISGSIDNSIRIWNWRTGDCIAVHHGHAGGVIGLHFDGGLVATGSVDRSIKVWNFESGSTFRLRGHNDWVNAVRVDAASRTLVSASDDTLIRLWDLDSRRCIHKFRAHTGQVQQVIFLPHDFDFDLDQDLPSANPGRSGTAGGGGGGDDQSDGSSSPAASSSSSSTHGDGNGNGNGNDSPHAAASEHQSPSTGPRDLFASFPADRPRPPRYMLTSALDSTVRLWDTQTGACLRTFFGHIEGVWGLAADTLRVVSGSEDRTVKMWDARTGRCERTFAGHSGPVTCVGLSDSMMVSGGEDGEVRVYCFEGKEG